MNINTDKAHWLGTLGILIAVSITSLSAQAASREDVILGVIAGAAVGYALSEHSNDVHIGYRYSGHYVDHRHHGKHCKHFSHHPDYYSGRRHTPFNAYWANQRHFSKHHHHDYHSHRHDQHYGRQHGHGHGKHRDGRWGH